MFASLVLATRGKPGQVWTGAAAAFLVHVAIATTVGVALFHLLPHRVVLAVVGALFVAGAAYAWFATGRTEGALAEREARRHGALLTAFLVIFVAEWGDLTQVLIANLAARYHSGLSVGVGSLLALWAVAGLAVVGGRALSPVADVRVVGKVTAAALLGLGAYCAYGALS
jgi:putative Ca2+/H+ antiporter (TMEM165/GDT1 family)